MTNVEFNLRPGEVIDRFSGTFRFLSNFYPAVVSTEGLIFPTVEHAYQAMKLADHRMRPVIRSASTPGRAKRLARKLERRADWSDVKVEIMRGLLIQKFNRSVLADQLVATGTARLVEGNTWGDVFWGVYEDEGENWLGRLLMEIREDLFAERSAMTPDME